MSSANDDSGALTSHIVIVSYDTHWPDYFSAETAALRKVPEFRHSEFHHVGSTSVPGLASKSIIDILIAVTELDSPQHYQDILKPMKYMYRDVHDPGRHFFERYTAQRFHLHIAEKGGWHYWRLMLFRDRLIRDAAAASQYVALKQELAAHHGADRAAYSGAKSDFVSRITLEELEKSPRLVELFGVRAEALRSSIGSTG